MRAGGLGQWVCLHHPTKKTLQEAEILYQEMVQIKLEKDTSEFGTETPDELIEALHQDPEATARFHQLKEGVKQYVIQHVAGVKSSELRVDRVTLLLKKLMRLPVDQEIYKEMLAK